MLRQNLFANVLRSTAGRLCFGLTLLSGMALSQAAQNTRVALPTTPPAALASAVDGGRLPVSQRLTLTLTFAQNSDRSAALAQYLQEIQTPSSKNYHRWLTPAQFASAYGASEDQISAATQWAVAQGLAVESISPSGTRITISGFVPHIESAFAVGLHSFRLKGAAHYATTDQPSLTADSARLFAAVEGLDDFASGVAAAAIPVTFAELGELVDGNANSVLTLSSSLCAGSLSQAQKAEYRLLFAQAAAQGITTIASSTCSSSGFLGGLAEVTQVANAGELQADVAASESRPNWQTAQGLPSDNIRHSPDLEVESVTAFASTLKTIAGPSARLGNINAILYRIAPLSGLFAHTDETSSGTWEQGTGLGVVNLDKLAKAFPRGTSSSFVSLAASSYAPTYGTSITFTTTVTSGVGGATPTGTVSFVTSSGTVIGIANLDVTGNGTFSTTATQLSGGTYTVSAQYSGDSVYAPVQSTPPATIIVNPETVVLTGAVSLTNTVGGTYTVTITATASASVGQPGGTVSLGISGTSTSYTLPLVPLGANTSSATFVEPATTVGTLTIAGNCAGTANFTCPNQYTGNVTIAKATPAFAISYSPNPPVSGTTISLTGTLGGNGTAPLPTGTVTFYDNGIGLNAASISPAGVASVTGVTPSLASHLITAIYNGDANYSTVTATGSSTTKTLTTTTVAASAYAVAVGQSVTLTATVNKTGATGTVSFSASTQGVLAPSVPLVNGVATFTTSTLVAGTYLLSATYSGDTTYAASTGTAPSALTLSTPAAVLTATASPISAVAGSTAMVTATVTLPGTVAPTGMILANITSPLGFPIITTGTLVAGVGNTATVTFPITVPAAGTYSVLVSCGSNVYQCNVVTLTLTSTGGAVLTATASPLSAVAGSTALVTATVTLPGTATPTGMIQASITSPLGIPIITTGTLVAGVGNTATATLPITVPAAGTYSVLVSCGSSNGYQCNGVTLSLTSTPAPLIVTTTTLNVTPVSPQVGVVTQLSAVVTPVTVGAVALTGTVNFMSGTTVIASGAVTGGLAVANVTFTSITPFTIAAVYSGDTLYATSTSLPLLLTPALATSAIVLSASPTSGDVGTTVALTAQVTGTVAAGTSPTGAVNFYLSGSVPRILGSVQLVPAAPGISTALLYTGSIPAGSQTVYAIYVGDTLFAPSTSTPVQFGVFDYSVTFAPANLTLAQGGAGSTTLQIATSGGFSGGVALTCIPPSGSQMSCFFSQSTVSGPGSTILTVSTTAASTASTKRPSPIGELKIAGGASLAALLCFLLPIRRRSRLPGLLMMMFMIGLGMNLGCSTQATQSVTNPGSPAGTVNFTIDTASTTSSNAAHHDYTFQVTVN